VKYFITHQNSLISEFNLVKIEGVKGMAVKLPKATVIKLFKKAGAARVSGDVAEVVNKIVVEIAKGAVKSAKAAGRKTVSTDDLRLVVVVS